MSVDQSGGDAPPVKIYSSGETNGLMLLVIAGVVSILAVLFGAAYYFAFIKRTKTYHRTNIAPYLVSLLLANVLQAIGTILNARWVHEGIIFDSSFCAFQGGLKNAANVGTALWSFMIALHVFNLLFLRWPATRTTMVVTLVGGWSAVVMIVTLGPLAIETPERGPYFGVSGYWCWITDNYPREQTYMEYFFEFMSAGLGFVLYALVLLRVRGNLTKVDDSWRLRWISRSQAWQLSFARDMLDSSMLRVATNMVWYPVAYSLVIIPVALARLSSFTGHDVPFWAIITTDAIFNLTGLVNSILFISTRQLLPDTSALPHFTTPRSRIMSDSESKYGVTPFSIDGGASALSVSSSSSVGRGDRQEYEKGDVDTASVDSSVYERPKALQRVQLSVRTHVDTDSDTDSDLGLPVLPRVDQETYTFSGSITVPTLEFSYPAAHATEKGSSHSSE